MIERHRPAECCGNCKYKTGEYRWSIVCSKNFVGVLDVDVCDDFDWIDHEKDKRFMKEKDDE